MDVSACSSAGWFSRLLFAVETSAGCFLFVVGGRSLLPTVVALKGSLCEQFEEPLRNVDESEVCLCGNTGVSNRMRGDLVKLLSVLGLLLVLLFV